MANPEWKSLRVDDEDSPDMQCERCNGTKFEYRVWEEKTPEHNPEIEYRCLNCQTTTFVDIVDA